MCIFSLSWTIWEIVQGQHYSVLQPNLTLSVFLFNLQAADQFDVASNFLQLIIRQCEKDNVETVRYCEEVLKPTIEEWMGTVGTPIAKKISEILHRAVLGQPSEPLPLALDVVCEERGLENASNILQHTSQEDTFLYHQAAHLIEREKLAFVGENRQAADPRLGPRPMQYT